MKKFCEKKKIEKEEWRKKMKRKIASILTLIMIMISLVPLFSTLSQAEEVATINPVNYYLDSKDFVVGEETGFYSWNLDGVIGINKDTKIVYQTEDGVLHTYTSEFSKESNRYEVNFKLDTVGEWKLLTINGRKVTDDLLDLMVYEDQLSHDAAVTEKLLVAIKKGIAQDALRLYKPLKMERISGKDRYQTAVEVSKETFPNGAKYAALATGEDFVDGLVGGSLTSQVDAPLLLTKKNEISDETIGELKRLKPETVFIFGGEAVVSKDVVDAIKKLDIKVERLYGKNRFDTANAIGAKRIKLDHPDELATGDGFHLVNAFNFADSLSASPFLGRSVQEGKYPIPLLVYEDPAINPEKRYVGQQLVFGGTAAVPKLNPEKRIAGKTRYETAVKVAELYKTDLKVDIDTVVLVSGEDFPDGLTSASVATMNNGAVLLTNTARLNEATKDFIENNKNIKKVIIVGGDAAVSEAVEKELKEMEIQYPSLAYEMSKFDLNLSPEKIRISVEVPPNGYNLTGEGIKKAFAIPNVPLVKTEEHQIEGNKEGEVRLEWDLEISYPLKNGKYISLGIDKKDKILQIQEEGKYTQYSFNDEGANALERFEKEIIALAK